MVKKQIKKAHEEKNTCPASGSCEKVFRVVTILLLLISITLSVVVLTNVSNSDNSQITSIDNKISKIDSFFTKNVPGYGATKVADDTNNQNQNNQNNADKLDVSITNNPVIGNKDAKVTIIEFSDFECPFCERFYSQSYKQLKTDYIDTGKVKLVFKNFPLDFHPNSRPAALAANCVRDQLGDTGFFKMHDKIYENQGQLSSENLETWAVALGVDDAKYKTCLTSDKTAAAVDADIADGRKAGVSGTPSFIINGKLIVGAQPYSVFKQTIDADLK